LYNNQTYAESNNNLLGAIDILENAQSSKDKHAIDKKKHVIEEETTFFSKVGNLFSVFKCGKN